jgi:DNA repair protein RecN (Recombination protein N)
MLTRIAIRNYLLIDALELEWQPGMTAITGETGSGKSILIGALELAMGGRADSGLQRDAAERCIIELELDVSALGLRDWFDAQELPYEDRTLVRRQLDPGGRSRAFVNDTPVKLEQVRDLGARLIHVHSQHQTQLLNDARFQLGLVDQSAGHAAEVEALTNGYRAWMARRRELSALEEEERRSRSEGDFLRFQHEELVNAGLQADEQERIEAELRRAEHAGELAAAWAAVSEGAAGDEGAWGVLNRLRSAVGKAARLDAGLDAIAERLKSCAIELKDIGEEAERAAASVEMDPARADRLRERLDLLMRLQHKHRAGSVQELLDIQRDLGARAERIGSLEGQIAAVRQAVEQAESQWMTQARAISRARTKAVKPLANKAEALLHELGMPYAVFQFDHKAVEPGPHGIDQVRALFSANKDRAPAPLDKVASGGELSRVMLALISLSADSRGLPIVVFDEIDTGVSGEVADRVGTLLAEMGDKRQVVAITHLPQIASKAATHLLVSKDASGERVRTRIAALAPDERVEAIARMLSGRSTTEAAFRNARELLRQAR